MRWRRICRSSNGRTPSYAITLRRRCGVISINASQKRCQIFARSIRDPRWLQWLTGRDALSGQIRQQLVDDAVAKGNAGRVIAFFRGFLQEAAAGRHGQPGQAAGGKPIYTRAQITQMASLRRKGVYSDAEWAAWEAELIAAG
jgi:hypothetical protein